MSSFVMIGALAIDLGTVYQLYTLLPAFWNIWTVFKKNCCPCIKTPAAYSCVNVIMSGLSELMYMLNKYYSHNTTFSNNIKNCSCTLHKKIDFEKLLKGRSEDLSNISTCLPQKYTCLTYNSISLKLVSPKCIQHTTSNTPNYIQCGIDKLDMLSCLI